MLLPAQSSFLRLFSSSARERLRGWAKVACLGLRWSFVLGLACLGGFLGRFGFVCLGWLWVLRIGCRWFAFACLGGRGFGRLGRRQIVCFSWVCVF